MLSVMGDGHKQVGVIVSQHVLCDDDVLVVLVGVSTNVPSPLVWCPGIGRQVLDDKMIV